VVLVMLAVVAMMQLVAPSVVVLLLLWAISLWCRWVAGDEPLFVVSVCLLWGK
jgi:hypothetical protein